MTLADKKQNEKSFPEVFYARHIQEGVVDYPEENEMNYISNDTLTRMAKSFDGKPVFVRHQDVDMANLKDQMDGVVSENFYNKYDGCWWVKMIIMSDEGKEAISRNFGVSNCYTNIKRGLGGTWHGVKYDAEIVDGEYEHLAIVENPRYENAIILTEDGYNNYIEELKSKLDKKMNSKTEEKHMNPFKLFQKKINEASIDDVYVDLGGGGHMLLKEALDKYEELRNADAEEEAKANRKFANGDDEVGLHDGSKVKISDVIERLNKCNKCNEKPEEEDEKEEEKENESEPPVAEEDEKAPEEDKENEAEEEKAEDKENESEEEKENEAEEKEEEEKENEAEEDEEEKEEKKQNSSELRSAYLNSGMSADIKDRAEFKAGKELLNGFEKAKLMGI